MGTMMNTAALAVDDADTLLGTSATEKGEAAKRLQVAHVENYKASNLTEERALELLGDSGLAPGIVAKTLGVTPARISQMLADPLFAEEVRRRRIIEIQKYSKRDQKVDRIEDKVLDKLEKALPLMHKTGEILNAVRVLTGIKRHTAVAADTTDDNAAMVQITLPTSAAQSFTVRVDVNNNVVQAGSQSLITAPMSSVVKMARPDLAARIADGSVIDVTEKKAKEHTNGDSSTGEIPRLSGARSETPAQGHELSENDI